MNDNNQTGLQDNDQNHSLIIASGTAKTGEYTIRVTGNAQGHVNVNVPGTVNVSGTVISNSTNGTAGTYNFVSVGTTPTLILASNSDRKTAAIVHSGTQTLYIGFDNATTGTTGFDLVANQSLIYERYEYTGPIYGVTTVGSINVKYLETI